MLLPQRQQKPLFRTITWISIVLCSSFLAFYGGIWVGHQVAHQVVTDSSAPCARCLPCNQPNVEDEKDIIKRRAEVLANQRIKSQLKDICKDEVVPPPPAKPIPPPTSPKNCVSNLFSKSIQHFVKGLARVSKDDLMQTFDFGVPTKVNPGNDVLDALILYNKADAFPSDDELAKEIRFEDPTKPLPRLTAKEATNNCDTMNVVLIDNPSNTRQCFALVGGQTESYHIQRWMRRIDEKTPLNSTYPLKLSSRMWSARGRKEYLAPDDESVKRHQEKLFIYLTEADRMKAKLKEILEKIHHQNTVVVVTCNFGQSELLMNFACSARSRGIDLQNVLVFPTDLETKDLAEGMGLSTFYEEKITASIPKGAAKSFSDEVFTSVMFAKVLCVQLVNELGYDLLFQDADVIWYQNPLDYFHDDSLPQFDIYFQDDGSRQERYAPYSANTGFYYVRSNVKTRHLLRHYMYASDLVDAWRNDQHVMNMLLGEHSSALGLSVKIFSKELEEFPGGLQYHRKPEMMKKIMRGESKAYIFHMSWTPNKNDKLKFFQQMGEWRVNPICIEKEARDIATDGSLADACCSSEPLITCYYKDKPSKLPCPNSPPIDKHGQSFW